MSHQALLEELRGRIQVRRQLRELSGYPNCLQTACKEIELYLNELLRVYYQPATHYAAQGHPQMLAELKAEYQDNEKALNIFYDTLAQMAANQARLDAKLRQTLQEINELHRDSSRRFQEANDRMWRDTHRANSSFGTLYALFCHRCGLPVQTCRCPV